MVFQFETGIYDDSITFLDQLADVKIENPQNGQAPVYDSSINKYTNQSVLIGDISSGNEGDTLIINSLGNVETNSVLRIDTVNNRVGINIPIGESIGEDFDVDGNIQIRTSGTEKITFYDNGHQHEHGRLLVKDDSTGAQFQIHVKEAGTGTPVINERFTIRENGAIGFNAQYGTAGQVLSSNGVSSPPTWVDTPFPDNVVKTYVNRKTLAGVGATDFFNIDRDIQRSFVIDLRIVGGDGQAYVSLYHTRTGVVFVGNQISIKNNEVIANTSFTGGGSAQVTSIIEQPFETQLDIRVQNNSSTTQHIAAYMTLYGSREDPTVIISP